MGFAPFTALTSKIFGGALIAAIVAVGVQSCRLDRMAGSRDAALQSARDTQSAFDATVINYRLAALQFALIAATNVARVQAERDAISERKVHELQNARDLADAGYRRLLSSAAEADSRSAGDADVSAVADATCRAYAAARCAELPALLKAAQDNVDQLIALQGWAAEQARVTTSPSSAH